MIPFADWAAAIARATLPSAPTTANPLRKPEDPRLDPVDGDDVDDLVNWQIEQGKAARQ